MKDARTEPTANDIHFRPGPTWPEIEARTGTGLTQSRHAVAQRDLARYYALVRDEIERLALSRGELLLILDAMNGVIVDPPAMYRSALLLDVADHIRLNGADRKWEVDGDALQRKLAAMSPGTLMALVDVSERFWARAEEDTDVLLRDLGLVRQAGE